MSESVSIGADAYICEDYARAERDKLWRKVWLQAGRVEEIPEIGDYLTFLFENADTVRYQVHEMMRIESIVKENDIQHELDTYNELLGGSGELGTPCSVKTFPLGLLPVPAA